VDTSPIKTILEKKLPWITAIALTLSAILLHIFSFSCAGPLWRDEVGLLNISLMPTWKEIIWGLMHDHCPVVFPALLRTWAGLGLAQTDTQVRILGLGVGLLLLASFWGMNWMLKRGIPLLSLSLVAVNPIVIRYGDSIRGYALGIALIALTMGLVWRFVEAPNFRRGLLAGIGAVLSVQALYQNAFFLLAIGIAGMTVSLRRRQLGAAAGVLGIGLIAALSLLPYIKPIRDAQSWWLVSQSGTDWPITLNRLSKLTGSFLGVWLAILIVAIIFGIVRIIGKPKPEAVCEDRDLPLYGTIALALGAIGFEIFIQLTGLLTQVWYFIPLLCFTVLCCDVILQRAHFILRMGVLGLALITLIISISPSAYAALRWQQSNGDLVAARVASDAAANDLVIVHPWYYGITFSHHFRGNTKWTTLPPLADLRFHRYDLVKEELTQTNAIEPVLKDVEATLRAGNRVWIVGQLPDRPVDDSELIRPPAAPYGPRKWDDQPYSHFWGLEVRQFLEAHITNAVLVIDPSTNNLPINPAERMKLIVVSGWKGSAQTNE
jgi:hypothetical protein